MSRQLVQSLPKTELEASGRNFMTPCMPWGKEGCRRARQLGGGLTGKSHQGMEVRSREGNWSQAKYINKTLRNKAMHFCI